MRNGVKKMLEAHKGWRTQKRKAQKRVQGQASGSFHREIVFGSSFGSGRTQGQGILDKYKSIKTRAGGASLVVQWLRIRLPTQGTRVRALVWEDPMCCGATKPVRHNY